jgi:hypothetical protein
MVREVRMGIQVTAIKMSVRIAKAGRLLKVFMFVGSSASRGAVFPAVSG